MFALGLVFLLFFFLNLSLSSSLVHCTVDHRKSPTLNSLHNPWLLASTIFCFVTLVYIPKPKLYKLPSSHEIAFLSPWRNYVIARLEEK